MEETPSTIAARIKQHAHVLGLDAVRITTAAPPAHSEAVAAWLQAGMHGKMAYLERRHELRSAPLHDERLLAGAQSVIMVALSYNFSPPAPSGGGARGVVARYARGEDYHNVLWEKLNALGKWIEATWPGAKTRGFTDSGPLRERELAARAGLGWQGRHTNLISLELGNWFFLGALLTTLELQAEEAVEAHCGTCTRCLGACPTGALVAPLTLDARRCISYLTIELKGSIPTELRPLMGNRIFGCDDCLAACPWNERAREAQEVRLAARADDAAFPNLVEWLAMFADEAVFKAKFAGTPILRTGREGLRRNVCVALGNLGGAESVNGLSDALATDPSPMVREHAAWALRQIARRGGKTLQEEVKPILDAAACRETDGDVQAELQSGARCGTTEGQMAAATMVAEE